MAASTKDMSAQLAQHAPVRLLIAERSENAAYQFDSLLRDAGIATRPEIIDLPMAIDKLAHADMMLCNAALPEVNQLLPRLASLAPRVPIILISNDDAPLNATEGMELGAADVVGESDTRHLVLVVKRELEHVCRNIQYRQMKKALAEAEQRCQLLLESSRAAIAYVHEGMHIHANEHYLQLFGFDDAEDLFGLPLIDLMESDSARTLKDTLKAFRNEEEETEFEFAGVSTNGDTINGSMTLAAADYEGEHCLQVTVRPQAAAPASLSLVSAQAPTTAEPTEQNSVAIDDADDVPVLDAEAIVAPAEDTAAAPSQDNGEQAQADINAAVDGIDFELDLEDTAQPDAEVTEDAADEGDDKAIDFELETTDSSEPVAVESEKQSDVADETAAEAPPAEQPAAGDYGRVLPLPEFLKASESLASEHDGQFVSIFVAQVDGYEDLQRAFGLAGVADACRQVEATLAARLEAPFVQVSPSQWGMLICAQTREEALSTVNDHRAAIEKMMFEVREKTVRPTCTFAGAILSNEEFDNIGAALEATLDNAITALRGALNTTEGNTVQLPAFENAEQEYDDEANRVLSLITEAIENQSFTLLFQPIISLRGDSDEHYEVFLRMSDREGKQMAPGEFLRTAIDNNVAGKIDRWVILQSIKMLSQHRANGHNTRLTINLTANSVSDPEFIQWLGVAIKAARMPSDAVIFQITERDASTYIRQTREFVEGLKHLHCRASLSRFGLADEPFEVLGHIPVDFVKLDGELIEALDKDGSRKDEVAEMVRELQNQGKLTIVPMVESASLLSTLWQAGVNYIQGHYLQEPSTNMDYDFSTDD
jgi:PAS domain S-box-containing protein